jgi:hypothetical protein
VQHRERERAVTRLARRPQVERYRRLQIRARRHEQVLAGRSVLLAAAPERVEPVVRERTRASRDVDM